MKPVGKSLRKMRPGPFSRAASPRSGEAALKTPATPHSDAPDAAEEGSGRGQWPEGSLILQGPKGTAHIVFRLLDRRYAVAVGKVIELDRLPPYTPVPNTPTFVLGVTNVRGDVLPVVDLRTLLAGNEANRSETARLLTIRNSAGDSQTGLVVDSLQGMRAVEPTAVRPSLDDGPDSPLVSGLFDDKEGEIRIFDVDRFFDFDPIKALGAG